MESSLGRELRPYGLIGQRVSSHHSAALPHGQPRPTLARSPQPHSVEPYESTVRLACRQPIWPRSIGAPFFGDVGSVCMQFAVWGSGGRRSGRETAGIAASCPRLIHSLLVAGAIATLTPGVVLAETLADALVRAYQGNPQLNAERAKLRGTDEGVPQALSGYRPQVTVGLSAGLISLRNL